jgi:DNA-binding NtrC family response regulator
LFELANGGSIFLDDIDDLPIELQPKLLRVLEAHELWHLGGAAPIRVDVRLITATKADLRDLANRGSFRADLYYRVNEVPIEIPPLRQRADDIPCLAAHFLKSFTNGRKVVFAEDALHALVAYSWPGNIRELLSVMRRISLFAEANVVLHEQDLPPEIKSSTPLAHLARGCTQCLVNEGMSMEETVSCVEATLLRYALERAGGNHTQAARLLKMNPSTFRDKLKKHSVR